MTPQPRAEDIPLALTDAEWAILAPLLPCEPPQADAMSQRELLDKVIWVIARGRRWTELDAAHEAVRRKFGRWAHAGVWQQLLPRPLPRLAVRCIRSGASTCSASPSGPRRFPLNARRPRG